MEKNKIPLWSKLILGLLTVIFSYVPGAVSVFATAIFAVLCIAAPSPILIICPLISFLLAYFTSDNSLYAAASCISYALPGAVMCLSYFKKCAKNVTVLNTAIATFFYSAFLAVFTIILQYGTISAEIVNNIMSSNNENTFSFINELSDKLKAASETGGMVFNAEAVESLINATKPFILAIFATSAFIMSYIAVCITNTILKKMKIIENKKYKFMPSWISGVLFLISSTAMLFVSNEPLPFVVFGSIYMILIPAFFIVGCETILAVMRKMFKNKYPPYIFLVIFILSGSAIVYNLLYLSGAFHCIIVEVKKYVKDKNL